MMLTPLIKRALTESITDLGQLSHADLLELNRAVRAGYLSKGKGGSYPKIKTVYAFPDYDFSGERERSITHMLTLADMDARNARRRAA